MFESIEDACRGDLIAIVRAYAKANGITVATVSRKFHGNQSFFQKFFDKDSTITLSKMADMVGTLSEAWPPSMPWPKVKVLHFADVRGIVYVARWGEKPDRIRIGFSRYSGASRLIGLRREAKKLGQTLEIAGSIQGLLHNERSIHRLLFPYAVPAAQRSWYSGPEVESFVRRMLAPGFVWECEELKTADAAYYPDEMCSGVRRKYRPRKKKGII